MDEGRLDKRAEEVVKHYNEPPDTPREEIWAKIESARGVRTHRGRRSSRRLRAMWLPAAAAAILLIGIAIGRGWRTETEPARVAVSSSGGVKSDRSVRVFRYAAEPVLTRADALLTEFRSSRGNGETTNSFSRRAESLLRETRLLLDSPATRDLELKEILMDLELTLVRIVRLSDDRQDKEREVVREGLNKRSILPRMRIWTPSGSITASL